MPKTHDDYFRDWEAHVFGFGYGSGEGYVLTALKGFLVLCTRDGTTQYDYRELEQALGGMAAWLLINAMCHAGIIEYGTSTRFGWLTGEGKRLQAYVAGKTVDELANLTGFPEGTLICTPDYCNCEDVKRCQNPFW